MLFRGKKAPHKLAYQKFELILYIFLSVLLLLKGKLQDKVITKGDNDRYVVVVFIIKG